jgi:hypothetical protein
VEKISSLRLKFVICSIARMDAADLPEPLPDDLNVPDGRDRLGRAHQLRVDISIALSLAPAWLRRALSDRNSARAQGARFEIVERIAAAIERRFWVTWRDSADPDDNARPPDNAGPLFGGPENQASAGSRNPPSSESVDSIAPR